MRSPRTALIAVLLTLTCAGSVSAEPRSYPVFLEDEPIYTSSNPRAPGFLMEIFQAMADQLNIEPDIHFMPWNRAQAEASNTPNGLIFPLARTAVREPQYLWLCRVFDIPVMFVTKEGAPVINSYQEARQFRGIGVIIGTPQERTLQEQGVPHVRFTGSELYQALANDEIRALYTARPEAVYGWRQGGFDGKLQFGDTLQRLPLWIAAGRASDRLNPGNWQRALQSLKASGYFRSTEEKYFGR